MKTVNVLFLASCANDRAGERKAIDVKRARRLVATGYVRVIEDEGPETAVTVPAEDAAATRPHARGPRPERRG